MHRPRLAGLAALVLLSVAGCHQSKPKRAARLLGVVARAELTELKGTQVRLAKMPGCDEAKRSVVAYIDAQRKALKPRTTELRGLLTRMTDRQSFHAGKLAGPALQKVRKQMHDLSGPARQRFVAFEQRCPGAAKAIEAADGRFEDMIQAAEHQTGHR